MILNIMRYVYCICLDGITAVFHQNDTDPDPRIRFRDDGSGSGSGSGYGSDLKSNKFISS